MTKKHIYIVHILAGKANPNSLNGVNKVVHNIATEQVNKGYNVSVCGIANNTIDRHQHIYSISLFKKSLLKIFPPIEFLRYLKINKKQRTVYHIHSSFIPWYIFLLLFLKLNKLGKVVVAPHGQYAEPKFNLSLMRRLYFILFESIVLRLSDKIHLIGKTEINKYTKKIIKNKYVLIPNSYELIPNEKKIYSKEQDLVFGYLGRLDIKQKGLDILLFGFEKYKKLGGKGTLKIAGMGKDFNELVELTNKLEITDSVEFLGAVFDDAKDSFYKSISIFIHNSRWEGFPTSCVEAASYGVPLFISKETNMEELVNMYQCGYVLTQNDDNHISKGLMYFSGLTMLELTKKSNQVVNMIKEELSVSFITDEIVDKLYLS